MRLMPIGKDSNLDNHMEALVASMVEGFENDFSHIIADELFVCDHKTMSALPFRYLITELCK